jgi:DNA-binding NtrC family response regulator
MKIDEPETRIEPGATVLVVEDEALIRMLLVDELEIAGFTVIEAENADEAIKALDDRHDVAVVATDVRMPGTIDGLGLAAWMRNHHAGVPIIIMSGFATTPDTEAINPAIVRVVAKPYRAREVANWLRAMENNTPMNDGNNPGATAP